MMSFDPRLLQGVDHFNRRLFFECHEILEEVWIEENGPDRNFYQGLIQIAAGYFKWEQGVPAGTVKLLRSGLEKIRPFEPWHLGVDVSSFAAGVAADLALVEASRCEAGASPALLVPTLSIVSPKPR